MHSRPYSALDPFTVSLYIQVVEIVTKYHGNFQGRVEMTKAELVAAIAKEAGIVKSKLKKCWTGLSRQYQAPWRLETRLLW